MNNESEVFTTSRRQHANHNHAHRGTDHTVPRYTLLTSKEQFSYNKTTFIQSLYLPQKESHFKTQKQKPSSLETGNIWGCYFVTFTEPNIFHFQHLSCGDVKHFVVLKDTKSAFNFKTFYNPNNRFGPGFIDHLFFIWTLCCLMRRCELIFVVCFCRGNMNGLFMWLVFFTAHITSALQWL